MDSGFDLNLDSEQFSSENLHSIEYWEQELDHVVNTQRELLSTPQKKTDFDLMVSDILEDLRIDNEVLDAELQDVMDEIFDAINVINVQNALEKIKAADTDFHSNELKDAVEEAISNNPKSAKFILSEVVKMGHKYLITNRFLNVSMYISKNVRGICKNIWLKDPNFVRSLFTPDDFLEVYHDFSRNITNIKLENQVLEVVLADFDFLNNQYFSQSGPLLFSVDLEGQFTDGHPYRQMFVELLYGLTSKNKLSKKNKILISKLKEQESSKVDEIIDNPMDYFSENWSFEDFIECANRILNTIEGRRVKDFIKKVLTVCELPKFILELSSLIPIGYSKESISREEFVGKKEMYSDARRSLMKFISQGYKLDLLSSKLLNIFYDRFRSVDPDLAQQLLLKSRKKTSDLAVFRSVEGLWLDDGSATFPFENPTHVFDSDGEVLNNLDAFNLIGQHLASRASKDGEVTLLYPGGRFHLSVLESLASAFDNSEGSVKSGRLIFTELKDSRKTISKALKMIAQKTGLLNNVSEWDQDSDVKSHISFNLKGKPVVLEFYLKAFNSKQDDWYGHDNLMISDVLILHDLSAEEGEALTLDRIRNLQLESETKLIAMTHFDFSNAQSKGLFDRFNLRLVDADPGAIFGCSCDSVANDGIVLFELSNK